MKRRTFLATAAAAALTGPLTTLTRQEAYAFGVGTIKSVDQTRHGTTFELELATAPFPHKDSTQWTDPTVWVFVPKHYRCKEKPGLDLVLHFHGHKDTAKRAMRRHRLRAQLYDSKQNAVLVMPQGPVKSASSDFGKLEDPRGLVRFLTELRRTLSHTNASRALGKAQIPRWARVGRVVLSAHSGGYRAVANCVARGAYPVSEVWLFDALYGEQDAFYKWLVKGRGRHRFWSFYRDPTPTKNSLELLRRLRAGGFKKLLHETKEGSSSRRELVRAKMIFILSKQDHDRMIWRRNAFRDCALASGFKRYLKSDWLEGKNGEKKPRKLESR